MIDSTKQYLVNESNYELQPLEEGYFKELVPKLLNSEDMAVVLGNQSLTTYEQQGVPPNLLANAEILELDPEQVETTVRRWYLTTPHTEDFVEKEVADYLHAREVYRSVVSHPRTVWATEQGLATLPLEVITEVQAEYFESTAPAKSLDFNQPTQKSIAIGLTAAAAKLATNVEGADPREAAERSLVLGLAASLVQEYPELHTPSTLLKPVEYMYDIQGTFTGEWFQNLMHLRDSAAGQNDTTSTDYEVRALGRIIADIIYYAIDEDMDQTPARVRFAARFFTDVINARWHILPLGPGADTDGGYKGTSRATVVANDHEGVFNEIFDVLHQSNAQPEGLTSQSVLEALKSNRSTRGEFTPHELVRNALIQARKSGADKVRVRELLAQLQEIVNSYTAH